MFAETFQPKNLNLTDLTPKKNKLLGGPRAGLNAGWCFEKYFANTIFRFWAFTKNHC